MNEHKLKIEKKRKIIALGILLAILLLVAIVIIVYEFKGEFNMPYKLSKIIIVSTAEGREKEEASEKKWNLSIDQDNDIYIYIDKNGDTKKLIESVTIENISITKAPKLGGISYYMPKSTEGTLFKNAEEFKVNDSLQYNGAKASNEKNLEIGSEGGKIIIRFANLNVAEYVSDDSNEIKHDGTLLSLTNTKIEDINFNVEFDLIIKVDGVRYKGRVKLEMPTGNIIEKGTETEEITDLDYVIFKRI